MTPVVQKKFNRAYYNYHHNIADSSHHSNSCHYCSQLVSNAPPHPPSLHPPALSYITPPPPAFPKGEPAGMASQDTQAQHDLWNARERLAMFGHFLTSGVVELLGGFRSGLRPRCQTGASLLADRRIPRGTLMRVRFCTARLVSGRM